MGEFEKDSEPNLSGDPLFDRLRERLESEAVRREQVYRRQLERTVETLQQTRHSFRSKQLKKLREEIERVLKGV